MKIMCKREVSMNRTIDYMTDESESGLSIERFLRLRHYSSRNLAEIKRMPESVLINDRPCCMKEILSAGDRLTIRISDRQ